MSIIHDALKKIDNQKGNDRQPITEVAGVKQIKRKVPVRQITITILFIASIIFFAQRKKAPGPGQTAKAPHPKRNNEEMQPLRPEKKYPLNGYILEGIIYDKFSPLAVINGRMLKKHDKIKTATIEEITPTHVIIDTGTNKEKLLL